MTKYCQSEFRVVSVRDKTGLIILDRDYARKWVREWYQNESRVVSAQGENRLIVLGPRLHKEMEKLNAE